MASGCARKVIVYPPGMVMVWCAGSRKELTMAQDGLSVILEKLPKPVRYTVICLLFGGGGGIVGRDGDGGVVG